LPKDRHGAEKPSAVTLLRSVNMLESELISEAPLASSVIPSRDDVQLAEEPPARFFNRELRLAPVQRRVLAEALDERLPLLERVRFLSIFGGNLDEFFMIRVSGLRTQMATASHRAFARRSHAG